MRRCRFACVGALLLALLLTGCGKAGTAPEDGGADFSETEQVETPEAADALTVKEIAQVNEAFAPFKERENVSYVNSICSFFTSYYERPEDLDLVEFLRYMGIGGTVEDEAEFQALKGAGGWPFQGVDSLDRMPVPIHRYRRTELDAYLEEHADITTADLTNVPESSGELVYLPETDAFYNFTSDAGPGMFICRPVGGEAASPHWRRQRADTGGGGGRPVSLPVLPALGRGGDMTEKGQQRTRGVHRGSFPALILVNADLPAGGNLHCLLGQLQCQHTAVVGGGNTLRPDAGDVEAPAVRAKGALAAQVAVLLVLLLKLGMAFGGNAQGVVLHIDVNVFLLKAGQIRLQRVALAFIGDVGFELRQTAAGEEVVVEKATLHLLHLGEGIPGAHRISAVRSHFKHNQFLLSNPDDP